MNFNLIENSYVDWNKIEDEFTEDFLKSSISNQELRLKYDMTHGEFKDCCNIVKSKYGLSRRPFWKHRVGSPKYYYKVDHGFIIMKRIDGVNTYFGFVPSLKVAEILVKMCENALWNVDVCKDFIRNWREVCV